MLTHAARSWSVELSRQQGSEGVGFANGNRDRFQGQTEIPLEIGSRCFSASQLTHLGQCAFKWFAGDLLKIQELREAETELSGRLRGRLYHKTLELATRNALETGSTELRQALLDRLDAAFREAEELEQLPELAPGGQDAKTIYSACGEPYLRSPSWGRIAKSYIRNSPLRASGMASGCRGSWIGLTALPRAMSSLSIRAALTVLAGLRMNRVRPNLDVQLPLYGDVLGQQLQAQEAETASVRSYYYSLTKAKPLGHRDKVDREP